VAGFALQELPSNCIGGGTIVDAGAVSTAIRSLFERNAFTTREVAASLSGNGVIVKKIPLPVMTAAELRESIYWEAVHHIPFDIQDVNIDYEVVESGRGADSTGTMDVLLVAAKRDKIDGYCSVIAQAGCVPVVVDVDAFAIQNAYEANYGTNQGPTVLMNVGASAININILCRGQSVFIRDISTGGNAYTEALQRELNLPFDRAEAAKQGIALDGVRPDEVRPVLQSMTENVLLEIQKTFDFFKGTASSDHIGHILLSGGASLLDGFAEALAARFDASVERLDAYRKVAFDRPAAGEESIDRLSSGVVALGLALRRGAHR
jgi:type IV pilus assembly protein PilM